MSTDIMLPALKVIGRDLDAVNIADTQYIVTALFFGFGVAFEVPVATYLVVRTGISSVESLRVKRPYIIVGSFTLGMILTPPDLISQILLAFPIWVLYEIALVLCRYTISTDEDPQEQDKMDEGDSPDSE